MLSEDDLCVDEAWPDGDIFDGDVDDAILDTLLPRCASDMSMASTVQTSPLVVEAFCTLSAELVYLNYPSAENGWTYRADQGSYSIYRWDLGRDVCMVAKHTTCEKAIWPRGPPCRNCEKKKRWRLECKNPCDVFFIFAVTDAAAAARALTPLVLSRAPIDADHRQMYVTFAPKINHKRKAESVNEKRMNTMRCRELNLRHRLFQHGDNLARIHHDPLGGPNGDASLQHDGSEQEKATDGDAPGADGDAASEARDADPEARPLLPQPSRGAPCGDEPSPQDPAPPDPPVVVVPAARRAEAEDGVTPPPLPSGGPRPDGMVVRQTIPSPLTRGRDVEVTIYEYFIGALGASLLGSDRTERPILLSHQTASILLTELRRAESNDASDATMSNILLSKLYLVLGRTQSPTLLVRPNLLRSWVDAAYALGTVVPLHFGFTPMDALSADTSESARLELHMHASYDVAAQSRSAPPVLCAFYAPHAPARVRLSNVLPIGF